MFVKNAIVKMDWDVEGFIESKTHGFVAAVHTYKSTDGTDIPVVFRDGKAFMLYNLEEGRLEQLADLRVDIKTAIDDQGYDCNMEEYYEEDGYIEVSNGSYVDSDIAESYGLSDEDCEDVLARIDDLSGYVEVTEQSIAQ